MNELQEIQGRLRQLASDLWTLGPEKAVLAKDPDTMRRAADLIGELERRRPPTPEDAMSEQHPQLGVKWNAVDKRDASHIETDIGWLVAVGLIAPVAAHIVALHNASLSPAEPATPEAKCDKCGGPATWLGHKWKCPACLREIPTYYAAPTPAKAKGICPNCGKPGPHFVPPSLGERGFYICDAPTPAKAARELTPSQPGTDADAAPEVKP
jgi:hypothetical protein